MEKGLMDNRIDALLKRNPALSRLLENLGIDYCCSGTQTLRAACDAAGLDSARVETLIAETEAKPVESGSFEGMGLAALADHIEEVHHAYLKAEIPRVAGLADKVARVHGRSDPRLVTVQGVFRALAEEMGFHMEKEERVLFPALRDLERDLKPGCFQCGSLESPIEVMKGDHADAADALERLRTLTDGYEPPPWACNTYRALLDGLHRMDSDLVEHIRKEEALLFLRALDLERKAAGN